MSSLPKSSLPQRFEERTIAFPGGDLILIDDTYSANPASLRAGLSVLALKRPQGGGRRIAILSELKELGAQSAETHTAVAPAVTAAGIDILFTSGPEMLNVWNALPRNFPGLHSEDPNTIVTSLAKTLKAGDIVYVKGTHYDEVILEFLMDSIASLGKSSHSATSDERSLPPASRLMPRTCYEGPNEPLQIRTKNENRLEILFLGDTAFGENYQAALQRTGAGNILKDKGYDYPLAKMRDTLLAADLVIANLETPLTNLPSSPFSGQKSYIHWGDIDTAPCHLLAHNISAVSLANNHSFDYGAKGFDQTLDVLSRHNIIAFGAGRDLKAAGRPLVATATQNGKAFTLAVISAFEFAEKNQARYGCYAQASQGGLLPLVPAAIKSAISETKDCFPDAFIVVFPHWGSNYKWQTRPQTELAQQLIAAGADLVLGHGPHMIQEIEKVAGRWVVFSIGNFMFNSPGRYAQKQALPFSLLARINVEWRDKSITKSLRLFPIMTDNKQTGYQTRYVDPNQFAEILDAIGQRSSGTFQNVVQSGSEGDRLFFELQL
jgi:poly-gamma-glutamate capsule biosynthesis protein CapA/YwtB (metallophosphatase superfamily)